MKIVLDTNVLLSALATRGLCEAVLEVCLAGHDLVLSEPILEELREHLSDTFKMPPARVNEIVAFLRSECTIVQPVSVPGDACRDPDDLMVLGTALAAEADGIVTGDKDLLVLGIHQGIPILSPRAFYDRLK